MDFTYFIQNKERIEVAEKPGLYCVMQSHLPKDKQAYRCGLAGKPVDSATQFKSAEGNFSSRLATYLNYWLPTDANICMPHSTKEVNIRFCRAGDARTPGER